MKIKTEFGTMEVSEAGKLSWLEFAQNIGLKAGRIANLKDVSRQCSRLLRGFIKGKVSGSDAKVIAYLLSAYVTTSQRSDLMNFSVKNRVVNRKKNSCRRLV